MSKLIPSTFQYTLKTPLGTIQIKQDKHFPEIIESINLASKGHKKLLALINTNDSFKELRTVVELMTALGGSIEIKSIQKE